MEGRILKTALSDRYLQLSAAVLYQFLWITDTKMQEKISCQFSDTI